MTADPVPAYPRGHGNDVDGPEIERLARLYQVHPEALESLLERLRALEVQAHTEHHPVLARARLHSGVVGAVCEHHGPVVGMRGVYCDGCDTDGEPPPDWPCSTWTMIAEVMRR